MIVPQVKANKRHVAQFEGVDTLFFLYAGHISYKR